MAFSPTNPFNGATVPGFTTPTYTHTPDVAPSQNGKQYAITNLGGTQAGVTVNSVSSPFTVTMFRPPVLRTLPQANPVTGAIRNVQMNQYKVITRKGLLPAANQTGYVGRITTIIECPAGAETYDLANTRAMVSAHIGVLADQSNGIAITVNTGVL